jgi:hypothetical protein
MIGTSTGRLALAGCLFLLLAGCGDENSGSAGSAGTGGAECVAGAGGEGGASPAPRAGLWDGADNGFRVCLFVGFDGESLEASPQCDLGSTAQAGGGAYTFDLSVDGVGVDQNGANCSFDARYEGDVPIGPLSGIFRVDAAPGSDGSTLSFSGEFEGDLVTGVARSALNGSYCEVGWAAEETPECDDGATISECLNLLDCCRAILINPIFFQTCNSVVEGNDKTACERVLAGYPQCAPDQEQPPP